MPIFVDNSLTLDSLSPTDTLYYMKKDLFFGAFYASLPIVALPSLACSWTQKTPNDAKDKYDNENHRPIRQSALRDDKTRRKPLQPAV